MRLFLILLAVPIIEIALFIEVGGWIGTWPTIAIVVLTALAGTILLRQQGLSALQGFQQRLAEGENPGRLLAEGAMILIAGALLLTPGFFTDAVGFALLMPPVRTALWRWAEKNVAVSPEGSATWHFQTGGGPSGMHAGGATVDGTYSEVQPDEPSPEHPAVNHDQRG
ncbi:MAG: FxsA family protein [Pseudomonadota bacterium]